MSRNLPPISRAKRIANDFDLDQVLILGRSIGDGGYQTMTTYGRNRAHCDAAGQIGVALMNLMDADGGPFDDVRMGVLTELRKEI